MPRDETEELKPFKIAVAPTVRLSEESALRPGAFSIEPATTYLPTPATRPKPPVNTPSRSRALRISSRIASFPTLYIPPTTDLAQRPLPKRVRERGIALCLFAVVSLALCVLSPVGALASAVCVAVAFAELRHGWARLSRKATRYAYAAMGIAGCGGLYQLVRLLSRLA